MLYQVEVQKLIRYHMHKNLAQIWIGMNSKSFESCFFFLPFHNRIHFCASFFPQLQCVSCLHHSRVKHHSLILLYFCWHDALAHYFKIIFHSCNFLILNDKKEIIYSISFILPSNVRRSTMFQSSSQVCSFAASYINNFSILCYKFLRF